VPSNIDGVSCFGPIHAQGDVEAASGSRQPVCLAARPGGFTLDVKVHRAVAVMLERHPAADRATIHRVV
jgi:hypothetical protein